MTAVSCCSVGSGAGTRSSGRRASLLARLASFRSPFAFLLPAPAPARHQGKTTRIRPPAVTGRAWCERGVRGAHDAGVSGRPRCVSALWRINRPTPSRTEENRAASVRSESERKKGFRSAASCWLGRCWRLLGPNRQRMRAHSAAPERSAAEILNDAVITARCRQTLKPCVNAETERQLSCLEGRGGGSFCDGAVCKDCMLSPAPGAPPPAEARASMARRRSSSSWPAYLAPTFLAFARAPLAAGAAACTAPRRLQPPPHRRQPCGARGSVAARGGGTSSCSLRASCDAGPAQVLVVAAMTRVRPPTSSSGSAQSYPRSVCFFGCGQGCNEHSGVAIRPRDPGMVPWGRRLGGRV